jgi:hypothetical protein
MPFRDHFGIEIGVAVSSRAAVIARKSTDVGEAAARGGVTVRARDRALEGVRPMSVEAAVA